LETLIEEPMSVAGFLAAVVAAIFWLSGWDPTKKLFEYTPPVIYVYFVPMLLTTAGVIPSQSPAYDWLTRYLLPFALFLLMISVDLKSVAKLGSTALIMVVTGTMGIVIGAPIALAIFKGALGPEAWKGFAALAGSWIGGTANMMAMAESVGTPDSEMGPVIVVDTVVGYGWMGVLIALSAVQGRFDRATGARTDSLDAINARMEELTQHRRPTALRDMAVMIGLGMGASVASLKLGGMLPSVGDPTIISSTTWAVLIVVTIGLALSFTNLRKLEEVGASGVGYTGLYLLLAAIGARADLRAVLDAPVYLAAGAAWLSVHIGLLFLVARLIRAPLFFVATGSMANVGGAASAPVVAGVYHPALASVGLLMAVAGYVLGIYGALGAVWLLGWVGGG
jgi:uncharacterized membrane protein